ncbi:hypothetical protein IDF54_12680 [Flavobacterium sp. SaA2.13]|uniref:hypothetical protein n=2 Tax=Flavobacterium TaxID=237 RepID=UPI00178C62D1|nr:hypothetical protein [Flavobacterium sp. SaA2.13]MBE1615714.1 hypothetical protein [Flavobacterium sp. SaA2.13]
MQVLKNVMIGFAISFIGSLPLGYLNIIGYTIFSNYGLTKLIYFLLGIITTEIVVIYFTLTFAEKISENKKLLKTIQQLSILFLFILSITITIQTLKTENTGNITNYINNNFYINGLLLNCLNLMQIPFWAGWSIYLMSNNLISTKKYNKIFYLISTLIGTLAGMITFIKALTKLANNITLFKNSINYILLLTFITLLIIQVLKYYKIHLKKV